jgi:hypothetical protein
MLSSFHSAALSRQIVPIIYVSSKHSHPFAPGSDDNLSGDPTSINAGAGVKTSRHASASHCPGCPNQRIVIRNPAATFPQFGRYILCAILWPCDPLQVV